MIAPKVPLQLRDIFGDGGPQDGYNSDKETGEQFCFFPLLHWFVQTSTR